MSDLAQRNSRGVWVTIVIYNAYYALDTALYSKDWTWRYSVVSYKASLGEVWIYLGLKRCNVELVKVNGYVCISIIIRAI